MEAVSRRDTSPGARAARAVELLGVGEAVGLALGAAALTIVVVLLLPERRALEMLSLFLAAIGAVYVGLAIADGRFAQLALQTAYLAVTGGLIWLGLQSSPYWLAVGYFAHGGWDLLNHSPAPALRRRGVLPDWYAPSCVAYDWVVGLLIVFALG